MEYVIDFDKEFFARKHGKKSFPISISSVNVTKSAGNCDFGHVY